MTAADLHLEAAEREAIQLLAKIREAKALSGIHARQGNMAFDAGRLVHTVGRHLDIAFEAASEAMCAQQDAEYAASNVVLLRQPPRLYAVGSEGGAA